VSFGVDSALAYRLPWRAVRLQPMLRLGFASNSDITTWDNILQLGGGVNWSIADNVLFRVEHQLFRWVNDHPSGIRALFGAPGDVHNFMAQLAVSFST
jgi:hypothetical protein